jgi:uncharacterized protein YjbI with pentapeptide repeats
MNRDQQPRIWWKDRRLGWVLAALGVAGLVIITILGYWQKWAWIELLWRWLELLIIPIVLAAGAFWFNRQERRAQNDLETRRQESAQALAREERENDRNIAEDRAREDALQRYLDRMSELILDKNLRESEQDDAVRATARARTFTVLRSLDGDRKGQVVRFLHEADLIGNLLEEDGEKQSIEVVMDLRSADLRGANLEVADLRGASLDNADLSNTHLSGVNLYYANLYCANLSGASLNNAFLYHADLSNTNLSSANLSCANLSYAKEWTNEQLAQASSLVGATLPDGTVIRTEEAWEEFKKRYQQ